MPAKAHTTPAPERTADAARPHQAPANPALDRAAPLPINNQRALGGSLAARPAALLAVQRTLGNRAATRMLHPIQRLITGRELVHLTGISGAKVKVSSAYEKVVRDLDLYAKLATTPMQSQDHQPLLALLMKIKDNIDTWYGSESREKVKKGDDVKKAALLKVRYEVEAEIITQRNIIQKQRDVDPHNAEKFGQGQVASVYKTDFMDGFEAVFKEDETEIPDSVRGIVADSGINVAQPNLGNRSIAMSKLDALLGTGVIPPTERAYMGGRAGTVMGLVDGKPVGKPVMSDKGIQIGEVVTGNIDFKSEAVQRGLSNLQLLDAIAGQFDRHRGNVMVTTGGAVKGIDNDFAFGVNMDATKSYRHDRGIPSFIDATIAQRIMRPDFSALVRKVLTGLLTEAEIAQTLVRLGQAQAYIGSVMNDGTKQDRLVNDWDDDTYDAQKAEGEGKNYLSAREDDVEFGKQQQQRFPKNFTIVNL